MKQYMPDKPIKWGFKLWVLATSDTDHPAGAGYVVDFNVYLGAQEGQVEEGLTHRVVIELLEPPDPNAPVLNLGEGYHLYVDNYYTSGAVLVLMMTVSLVSYCDMLQVNYLRTC